MILQFLESSTSSNTMRSYSDERLTRFNLIASFLTIVLIFASDFHEHFVSYRLSYHLFQKGFFIYPRQEEKRDTIRNA